MKTSFKLVCIDDSSPFEFQVLDDTNKGSLDEIFAHLKENIGNYNIENCKWLLLPIFVSNLY